MPRLILVCGATGAGKTTYSRSLCDEISAIRFSIDPWMQTLFRDDFTKLDFAWMYERVQRCGNQIWEVSSQILARGGHVVLDLAFTTKNERSVFFERARDTGIEAELHYLKVPVEVRRRRVDKRNREQDPAVYSFEVTDYMFDFMEPRFEPPEPQELEHGCIVTQ